MASDVDWLEGPDGRQGESWNWMHGCDRVSSGCDLCYALAWAPRLKGMGVAGYQHDGDPRTSGPGFAVVMEPQRLTDPLRWRAPRRVFVNSMGDAWHKDVSRDMLVKAFAVMTLTPRHTYLILTKRPAVMRSFLLDECRCGQHHAPGFHLRSEMAWAVSAANPDRLPGLPTAAEQMVSKAPWPLAHLHVGVSAEDQKTANLRLPALLDLGRRTMAGVLWCSFEPLIGAIDLTQIPGPVAGVLDWAVIGGESGALIDRPETPAQPGAPGKPARRAAAVMQQGWAEHLLNQCAAGGVPAYFKQLGSQWAHQIGVKGKGNHPADWPNPYPRQYPTAKQLTEQKG
jgi:protein gp37